MISEDKVNILLVDDQPSKLLTYEVILQSLDDNLIKASSGKEALEQLLKNEIAVILVDVCMPELDGFELASLIREHPRFKRIAIIFISAIHLAEIDHLRGYEKGAVDYLPVPVVPELLRAKVRVFADLYRKSRQLERLNAELEHRVARRTAELEASTSRLLASEQRRSLALAAGSMGSWDWDLISNTLAWDEGQHAIFGVTPGEFSVTPEHVKVLIAPEDWEPIRISMENLQKHGGTQQTEYRVHRPNGQMRWCISNAAATKDAAGRVVSISGVTVDVTDRKNAEEQQALLAREVDHRAKNAMAIVQSIVKLTKAGSVPEYANAIEGRIKALSRAHALLSDARWQGAELTELVKDELAPYFSGSADRIVIGGPNLFLDPTTAQTLALALHELATNCAKHGALSQSAGRIELEWEAQANDIVIRWHETGGPPPHQPRKIGFGMKIITLSIERQLGGTSNFEWRQGGLFCSLRVPRNQRGQNGSIQNSPRTGCSAGPISGQRIMIVEDEALVAMGLEEQLIDLGRSVVAISPTVDDAMKAIDQFAPDAAILDVNLCGEFVYPVASRLMALGTPFIFITGYGRESIDQRYSTIPILEKPIDRSSLEQVFADRSRDFDRVASES
ncbi:MAG: response regulator [Xanthobacteraceae bacterium]